MQIIGWVRGGDTAAYDREDNWFSGLGKSEEILFREVK